jgi:hypothetical protein
LLIIWKKLIALNKIQCRLRTASPGEFVLAGIVAFMAFVVLGATQLDASGRSWKGMYNQGVIDKREYYEE